MKLSEYLDSVSESILDRSTGIYKSRYHGVDDIKTMRFDEMKKVLSDCTRMKYIQSTDAILISSLVSIDHYSIAVKNIIELLGNDKVGWSEVPKDSLGNKCLYIYSHIASGRISDMIRLIYRGEKFVRCECTMLPRATVSKNSESNLEYVDSIIKLCLNVGPARKEVYESILSRESVLYGPHPEKESIIQWCKSKGFDEIPWGPTMSVLRGERKIVVGPNRSEKENWLWVLDNGVGTRISFWFNSDGSLKRVIKFDYGDEIEIGIEIGFEEAVEKLESMLK